MENTPKIVESTLKVKASASLEDSVKKDVESVIDEEKAFAEIQSKRKEAEKPNS